MYVSVHIITMCVYCSNYMIFVSILCCVYHTLDSGYKAISEDQCPLREQKDLPQPHPQPQPQPVERVTFSSPEHHAHLQMATHDSESPYSNADLSEGTPVELNSSNTRAGPLIPR